MVATILAVNRIGVEGGAKSEIGEARFLMRGLAISPPRFSRFCKRAFPPDFFEKKKTGGNSWAGAPTIGQLAGVAHLADGVSDTLCIPNVVFGIAEQLVCRPNASIL